MAKYVGRPTRLSPAARVTYTKSLFEAKAFQPGQTPKYSVRVMFDKNNKEHMAYLKTLAADAASVLAEHWPDEASRPKLPFVGATHNNPIKDGDTATNKEGTLYSEKDSSIKGHYFIGVSSRNKPAVVNSANFPITDPNDVYPGCWCEVALNVYTYDTPGKGVTIGLNGVRKRKDDERIGGGPPAINEMFGEPVDNGGADDPFKASAPVEVPAGGDPFGA